VKLNPQLINTLQPLDIRLERCDICNIDYTVHNSNIKNCPKCGNKFAKQEGGIYEVSVGKWDELK